LGTAAEFFARRGFGRAITKHDAHEILKKSREAGLVQLADNVQNRPSFICNCCSCCCEQLRAINEFQIPAVNPSGFEPAVDDEKCCGCGLCEKACPIDALCVPERQDGQKRSELRPELDAKRCIGCGVCAEACKRDALAMDASDRSPEVPRDAAERVLRMAVERGRLANMLIGAGTIRGPRFLTQLLSALRRLPRVQQALANQQLGSRFVAWTLARQEKRRPKSQQGRQQ
jgi:Pyruvate/2-oxoacid:ferredoxin oxidoreductase delta subunit